MRTQQNRLAGHNLELAWRRAAVQTAIIAGVFSAIVCALLGANIARNRTADLLTARQITALKAELAKHPKDEVLKGKIRRLDLQMRGEYFRRKATTREGTLLLLGGISVLLISLQVVRRPRALPDLSAEAIETPAPAHRRAVTTLGLLGGTALIALAVLSLHDASATYVRSYLQQLAHAPSPRYYPSARAIAQNWSRFRGPNGSGVVERTKIPETWNGPEGTNIRWKTPVPLPGMSSPVVWGNRVFLSGADAQQRALYCFNADTGTLRWTRTIPGGETSQTIWEDTGYAAPTPVTDGKRVFASYAAGELIAVDFAGRLLWQRNLGAPDNMYGHASSLAMWRNRVIVQYDQGPDPTTGKSALLALDAASGKTIWETSRPVQSSWSTPIIIRVGWGEQIITAANPWVIAYDPARGKEIWRAECLSGDVAPSPIAAGGLVFVCNTGAELIAIRPNGKGNVTKRRIVWRGTDGLPDITSPVSDGKQLFLLTSDGVLTCYDAQKGKKRWEQYLTGEFHASPMLINGKLYVMDHQGVMHIYAVAGAFKEQGTAELGEGTEASPAVAGGRLYLRGSKHLYCIGTK